MNLFSVVWYLLFQLIVVTVLTDIRIDNVDFFHYIHYLFVICSWFVCIMVCCLFVCGFWSSFDLKFVNPSPWPRPRRRRPVVFSVSSLAGAVATGTSAWPGDAGLVDGPKKKYGKKWRSNIFQVIFVCWDVDISEYLKPVMVDSYGFLGSQLCITFFPTVVRL